MPSRANPLMRRMIGPYGDPSDPGASRPMSSAIQRHLDSMAQAGVAGSETSGVAGIRQTYPYQSYFDSGLVERAILSQPPTEPIVASTVKKDEQTPGYGVGLYPASESPIGVQLIHGKDNPGGARFVLRPGECFWSERRFDGIRYGLPFGWLGGGTIQLRVFQGQGDRASFINSGQETLFHRVRLPVLQPAAPLVPGARGVSPNWPNAFPWVNAFSFAGVPQRGQPSLVVNPTKAILRLRANPAVPVRMALVFLQTDDLDLTNNGASYDATSLSGSRVEFTWQPTVGSGVTIGGVAIAEFPVYTLDDPILRIGGGSAIALLIDLDAALGPGVFVDVERWGYV